MQSSGLMYNMRSPCWMQSIVTSVVPPERAGRAIATVVSGLTFATSLGVPLGAMIGQRFGWRAPFAAVAIIALAGGIILAASMPRTPTPPTGIRGELRVLARRPVLLATATTAIGFAGVGTVLTYIVPLLTQVTGFATTVVSALLLAYGGGSVLGNLAAGRLTDISLTMTLNIAGASAVGPGSCGCMRKLGNGGMVTAAVRCITQVRRACVTEEPLDLQQPPAKSSTSPPALSSRSPV
jgi:predicted MFS family arabinose efflux permease